MSDPKTENVQLPPSEVFPSTPDSRRRPSNGQSTPFVETRSNPDHSPSDLTRIREILFGGIVSELERRLARTDREIADRTQEILDDARRRTDVLEMYVRKEIDAISARGGRDLAEVTEVVRDLRRDQKEALAVVEQRVARLEERMEGSIARIERETRQQLLDQAKSFLDQLERERHQVKATIARELGPESAPFEEGSERGGV